MCLYVALRRGTNDLVEQQLLHYARSDASLRVVVRPDITATEENESGPRIPYGVCTGSVRVQTNAPQCTPSVRPRNVGVCAQRRLSVVNLSYGSHGYVLWGCRRSYEMKIHCRMPSNASDP